MILVQYGGNIHICVATRWSEANLLPILDDPTAKSVIILFAQSDKPSAADRTESIRPGERMKSLLKGLLSKQTVYSCSAPTNEPLRVIAAIQKQLSRFETGKVILNVTGGQKLVCFAALGAVNTWASADPLNRSYQTIYVRAGPPPKIVEVASSNPQRQKPRRADTHLRLEELLKIRGLKLLKRQETARFPDATSLVTKACTHPHISQRFANIIAMNKLARALGAFDYNQKNNAFPRKAAAGPMKLKGGKQVLDQLADLSTVGAPLSKEKNHYVVKDQDSLTWIAGGWFEEACFLAAKRWAGNEAAVYMNVELGLSEKGPNQQYPLAIREMDVVVWRQGLMYVLEAKTGELRRSGQAHGISQDTINKLSTIRREIVGPFGHVLLLNPRLMPNRPSDPGHEHWKTLSERSAMEQVGIIQGRALIGGQAGLEKALRTQFDQ